MIEADFNETDLYKDALVNMLTDGEYITKDDFATAVGIICGSYCHIDFHKNKVFIRLISNPFTNEVLLDIKASCETMELVNSDDDKSLVVEFRTLPKLGGNIMVCVLDFFWDTKD